jgi:uncharacterized membrane protein YqjE
MADAGHNPSADSGSEGHVRGFVQAGLRYAEARGKLFQIEAHEAGGQLAQAGSRGLLAFGCLAVAWLLAMPAVVVLLAEWLQPRWAWLRWEHVALGLSVMHLLLGMIFLSAARNRWRRVRLFEESLNQFQKDREWVARSQQPRK